MRACKNCGDPVHVADFRTGLIHTNGRYICRKKNYGAEKAAE